MRRTKDLIIEFITRHGRATPHELMNELTLSRQILHRHLKDLVQDSRITKLGKPPRVFYQLIDKAKDLPAAMYQLSSDTVKFLENRYLYIDPQGHLLRGIDGFYNWLNHTGQTKNLENLLKEFIKIRSDADCHLNEKVGLINATEKFMSTFGQQCCVEEVFYLDFYSLPKFGKTELGNLVLFAKQSQNRNLMKIIAEQTQPVLEHLIRLKKIDAVVWVPHSIPRQIQFLKEIERLLKLNLPKIEFVKAYAGEIPIPQKSLSKLAERIENAMNTLFIKNIAVKHRRILVIDDAVGSGATIQAVATKLKEIAPKAKVFGFAIVGSLKGFEVLKEV